MVSLTQSQRQQHYAANSVTKVLPFRREKATCFVNNTNVKKENASKVSLLERHLKEDS